MVDILRRMMEKAERSDEIGDLSFNVWPIIGMSLLLGSEYICNLGTHRYRTQRQVF